MSNETINCSERFMDSWFIIPQSKTAIILLIVYIIFIIMTAIKLSQVSLVASISSMIFLLVVMMVLIYQTNCMQYGGCNNVAILFLIGNILFIIMALVGLYLTSDETIEPILNHNWSVSVTDNSLPSQPPSQSRRRHLISQRLKNVSHPPENGGRKRRGT